jgi:hypothetical protein
MGWGLDHDLFLWFSLSNAVSNRIQVCLGHCTLYYSLIFDLLMLLNRCNAPINNIGFED